MPSNWQVQAETKKDAEGKDAPTGRGILIAPNAQAIPVETVEGAKAVKAALDAYHDENAALKAEKAEAFLAAKEEALLQAEHEFEDFFKKRNALVRDKRARGERVV